MISSQCVVHQVAKHVGISVKANRLEHAECIFSRVSKSSCRGSFISSKACIRKDLSGLFQPAVYRTLFNTGVRKCRPAASENRFATGWQSPRYINRIPSTCSRTVVEKFVVWTVAVLCVS